MFDILIGAPKQAADRILILFFIFSVQMIVNFSNLFFPSFFGVYYYYYFQSRWCSHFQPPFFRFSAIEWRWSFFVPHHHPLCSRIPNKTRKIYFYLLAINWWIEKKKSNRRGIIESQNRHLQLINKYRGISKEEWKMRMRMRNLRSFLSH